MVQPVSHRVLGLSPRVRGNPVEYPYVVYRLRSIPACAGEPLSALGAIVDGEVYPRVCGGTHFGFAYDGTDMGLSPRVRGNRRQRRG